MNGTNWVAPNEGDTLRQIFDKVGCYKVYIGQIGFRCIPSVHSVYMDYRTNLKLTSHPITEYDRERVQSDCFQVGELLNISSVLAVADGFLEKLS